MPLPQCDLRPRSGQPVRQDRTHPDSSGSLVGMRLRGRDEGAPWLRSRNVPRWSRRDAEFLQSGEFARYFPEYGELPIVPAFSLVTYLTRRGVYALAMGDEALQVLNLEAVRSRRAAP